MIITVIVRIMQLLFISLCWSFSTSKGSIDKWCVTCSSLEVSFYIPFHELNCKLCAEALWQRCKKNITCVYVCSLTRENNESRAWSFVPKMKRSTSQHQNGYGNWFIVIYHFILYSQLFSLLLGQLVMFFFFPTHRIWRERIGHVVWCSMKGEHIYEIMVITWKWFIVSDANDVQPGWKKCIVWILV